MNDNKPVFSISQGNPEIMGAVKKGSGVNFAMRVPDGAEASLILTDSSGKEVLQEIPLSPSERTGEVSAVFAEGKNILSAGYYYIISGSKVMDPYARMISDGVCRFVRGTFAWENDKKPEIPLENLMIYKLHVRGFTKQKNSGVREKGTFKGVERKLPYISEMGFNAVEFMPMYEWDSALKIQSYSVSHAGEEEFPMPGNYWGYAENNFYFAPKQEFSHTHDSVSEVKSLIKSLHAAGMEGIMEFYIPPAAGPMYVISALRYWKMEYHIDGFHLIGCGIPVQLIVSDPLLCGTKLFFENTDEERLYGGRTPFVKSIINYNDGFMITGRRFLKGDEGMTAALADYIRKNPDKTGTVNYMANVNGFTLMDCVSYDWKHNEKNGENNQDGSSVNFSWNCGMEGATRKSSVSVLRMKQIRNALSYVFLSSGIPLLLAGDEFGNSQEGNNNAYFSDNPVGWVSWNEFKKNRGIRDFLIQLTAFRKAHPILHPSRELRGTDYKSLGFPDISYHDTKAWYCSYENASRSLGVMYCGLYAKKEDGTADDFIYTAYNSYWEDHTFALPTLPADMQWYRVMDTDAKQEEGFFSEKKAIFLENQREFPLSPRSAGILIAKKNAAAGKVAKRVKLNERAGTLKNHNKTS